MTMKIHNLLTFCFEFVKLLDYFISGAAVLLSYAMYQEIFLYC